MPRPRRTSSSGWSGSTSSRAGATRRCRRITCPDLVEALFRSGRTADAEARAIAYAEEAERVGRASALAAAERCLGLVATAAELDERFEAARRHNAEAGNPFESARTDLLHGERLRREGRRVDGRGRLRAALDAFATLGAEPWVERAQSELRASGEVLRRRDPAAIDELTPQELQIALVVSEGVSNREAAARLFLSPKTVEFHLGHVYRKLGLRSRAELAQLRDHETGGLRATASTPP